MASGAISSGNADASVLTPAFEPKVFSRNPRRIAGPLRVTLFNARGGAHLDGIAACFKREPLATSSIILLCESDWGTARSRKLETAAELAARLEMSFAYVPEFGIQTKDGTHRSFLGNAILSTIPLEDVRAVALPLPLPEVWRGNLRGRVGLPAGLVATVRLGARLTSVGVVHLASHGDPFDRDRQMAAYLASFPADGPAIIGGDLNTTTTGLANGYALVRACAQMLLTSWRFRSPQKYEPLFKRIAAAGLEIKGVNAMRTPTFTFSRAVPPFLRPKLDWLAVRDFEPVRGTAAVVSARPSFFSGRISDHDFVTVQLSL